MHVLVTGGSGFLGRALCKALLAKGFKVTAMIRRADALVLEGVEKWIAPDLPELAWDAEERLAAFDVVIHAAARAHILVGRSAGLLNDFRRVNTEGTIVLARAAAKAKVQRFIFISSIHVNGNDSGSKAFCHDDIPQPKSAYAQSKWEAEQALTEVQLDSGMLVFNVRPSLIYGPGAGGNIEMLAKLIKKAWVLPFGSFNAPRRFVAIDNVTDLLTHIVGHSSPPPGVYLVADREPSTVASFIRALASALGRRIFLLPFPLIMIKALGTALGRGEQIRKLSVAMDVDIKMTEVRLGWAPPHTMEISINKTFK